MFYNEDFLKSLMQQKNRIIYARITSLSLDERPQETIEGRVTAGSINLDGASAIRRTCSLTLVSSEVDLSDYYWGLHTKFKLEVGIQNNIDSTQPDVIWFNQGIYLITTFSQSYSATAFTININGKDKMSRLNGELGGSFNSSIDFGNLEEVDKYGNIIITPIPVKQIIREMLHQYGEEPFHNIVINDLDEMGLQLKEYAYDVPLYLFRNIKDESSVYFNGTLNGKLPCLIETKTGNIIKTTIDNENLITYDVLIDELENLEYSPTPISLNDSSENLYYITKIVYGQTAGYSETDLTYPGSLIANIGESITSVLDKIKNFLGDFEYFYDVDGRFIFQRKKEWVTTSWNPITNSAEDSKYVQELAIANPYTYVFNDSEFFTAFNNTPNIANLKNDFTVWGTNANNLPIHMRYAIDNKPTEYTSINVLDIELQEYNEQYGFVLLGQNSITYKASNTYNIDKENPSLIYCDWREIIYQMALDYRKYSHLDDFELRVARANPNLYPTGKTGYEQYYIDLEGFWRQLYNPQIEYQITYIEKFEEGKIYYIKNPEEYKRINYLPGINDHQKYYILTKNNTYEQVVYPYDAKNTYYVKGLEYIQSPIFYDKDTTYYIPSENYYYPPDLNYTEEIEFEPKHYWNKNVLEAPENLLFWFDFLDFKGELEQFSVKAVGARQKAVNDNTVKAIHYRDIPLIIFRNFGDKYKEYEGKQTGYKYFNISSGLEKMFYTSSQGKSAKEAIDTLLYNHAYIIESVNVTSVPIYYLQPNTRIYISDVAAGIEGEYIASKLTIPLTYNGTMSITATKAATRLL